MDELKVGTLIRILPVENSNVFAAGDTARICLPPVYMQSKNDSVRSFLKNYWADFNDCGNTEVFEDGIWSIGKCGMHFEVVEEEPELLG